MANKNKTTYYLFIIGVLYFVFGFVTWLNNVLIPFLQTACELNDLQAWFVTFAFYIAYFVTAIPSSYVIKKTNYAKGMAIGLIIMMIGALLFIPAALSRNYIIFLVGLFVQGSGLSLMQTAVNPYVTILGPIESAAKRMSIMGISNKIAGMIGMFLFSTVLLVDTKHIKEEIISLGNPSFLSGELLAQREVLLNQLAHHIIKPYIIISVLLLLLALMVLFSKLPDIEDAEDDEQGDGVSKPLYKYTYMFLGVIALFFYVGAEVIAIDSLNLFGAELGYSIDVTRFFGPASLVALTLGYVLSIILVPKKIDQRHALIYQTILAIILTVVALLTSGTVSIICIILLSFAHAIMWPAIWPLSLDKLGKHTKFASALLIMAIAGGAIIPLIYGSIADSLSRHQAYIVLIPCYLVILFFALYGYKIGKKKA
ncbi:MAG: sugar MFS transporter [Bacteroidales bacterium]|jgi:FHS family L-fucose permease-like MFS transporter